MSLRDHIVARVAADGPITLADYMHDCLLHPTFGYYATRDPFGAAGDFVTAPEISQMFGELIGLCLAQCWIEQGRPTAFTLAELGPGRGTLMADILRATASVPGFTDAAHVLMIEASAHLAALQQRTVTHPRITWRSTVDDLPHAPLFLVANEFFDALPAHQFQRDGKRWRERQIGVKNGALSPGLGPALVQRMLDHRLDDTQDGDIVEYTPGLAPIVETITDRIASYGGAALIFDYGDWRSLGDTFQAMQAHAPVDPFAEPGSADLTTHVDFEAVTRAAKCAFTRLTPQGVFLERLGITQRANALAQHLKGDALQAHIDAHRRLTHPDEMGNLFKVLGLFPPNAAPPPGLDI